MADARFYWYPDPLGTLETIDLTEGTAEFPDDRNTWSDTNVATATRADGRTFRAFMGGDHLVRVRCSGIEDQAIADELGAMINHLRRGYTVGFTLSKTKAWGSVNRTPVYRGSANTGITGHAWYEAAPAIAAGDRIVAESPAPEFHHEVIKEDVGLTATSTILTHAISTPRFTYSGAVHFRYVDFWPVLSLPANGFSGNPLVSDGDRLWTLDLTLLYDVATALAVAQGRGMRTTTGTVKTGLSVEQAIATADLTTDLSFIRSAP